MSGGETGETTTDDDDLGHLFEIGMGEENEEEAGWRGRPRARQALYRAHPVT